MFPSLVLLEAIRVLWRVWDLP